MRSAYGHCACAAYVHCVCAHVRMCTVHVHCVCALRMCALRMSALRMCVCALRMRSAYAALILKKEVSHFLPF